MSDYIWIIAGGLLQIPAIEIVHELGYKALVTDKNPDCACAKLADKFFPIDTKDIERHLDLAKALCEWDKLSIQAVWTGAASVELTVARAAEKLGLPGIPVEVAYQISNKAAMRQILDGIIPQPQFLVYSKYPNAKPFFPCIVKPTDNSGSRGLTKCYKPEQFTREVFERAKQNSTDKKVLIEALLEPVTNEIAEQSVETVWYEGKGYWLNYVDRPFLENAKYAIEKGHYNPALHSGATQREIERQVLLAGQALGMTTGIFKADVMITKQGVRILETTARLSGGFDSTHTSPLAHGVNYIRGSIKLALGQPIDWDDFLPRQYKHAVALAKFPQSGIIKKLTGIERAQQFAQVFCRMDEGDIIPPMIDCTARPIFAVADGWTREQAIERAQTALDMIQVKVENQDGKR